MLCLGVCELNLVILDEWCLVKRKPNKLGGHTELKQQYKIKRDNTYLF